MAFVQGGVSAYGEKADSGIVAQSAGNFVGQALMRQKKRFITEFREKRP